MTIQGNYRLASLEAEVGQRLADWESSGRVKQLWDMDATVWTNKDEAQWLDWLYEVEKIHKEEPVLREFAQSVQERGIDTAVLLGMGGSSLGPEVLSLVYGKRNGIELKVLDSVDPAQISALDATLDYRKTLFLVASKSGSTLEPDIFCRHFFAGAKAKLGDQAPNHFVAITDPGSKLEAHARAEGFLRIFSGEPGIGGRYSIFSPFGMVPGALLGLDLDGLLASASTLVDACKPATPVSENPGLKLGLAIGAAAKAGRDKLTLLASPQLSPFGAWVEQLIAESTGKLGVGIIPVDAEPVGNPDAYGNDRLFVYLRLPNEPIHDELIAQLSARGHPVITFELENTDQMFPEFFRWEFATAVAGAVLGINPFDQPDVEAAKVQARELIASFERDGSLPEPAVLHEEAGLRFYSKDLESTGDSEGLIRQFLGKVGAGDYFAILAYLPMFHAHSTALQKIRELIRNQSRVATTLGFGPRFLHSTGQLHKGGPNSGCFLVLTCDDAEDLAIPDSIASFSVVKSAQASGDMAVLEQRNRRVLRVHLGVDIAEGLAKLQQLVTTAFNH